MVGCTSESGTPGTPTETLTVKISNGTVTGLPLGLDEYLAKIPPANPLTEAKVDLGKHLYFDVRLSADSTVSCATCHAPEKGWSDGRKNSEGIRGQVGGRNAPTVINRVFSEAQFWDGRAASLEEQALGPVQNPIEMGHTLEGMLTTLNGVPGYKPLFAAAFGDDKITSERVGQAIASFERTIVSGNSPFDRYEGGDKTAMSEAAIRGLAIFKDNQKGRCSICHVGSNLTDEKYHNIGVGMDQKDWETNHTGRYGVSKNEKEKGAFKTPTLRQIAESGPYMHDGSEATLEAVVELYAKGGNPSPHLDPEMKKLDLTEQDKKDLVEFMKALSGQVTAVTIPTPVK
jgi:cytochrome c peroxidase